MICEVAATWRHSSPMDCPASKKNAGSSSTSGQCFFSPQPPIAKLPARGILSLEVQNSTLRVRRPAASLEGHSLFISWC